MGQGIDPNVKLEIIHLETQLRENTEEKRSQQ